MSEMSVASLPSRSTRFIQQSEGSRRRRCLRQPPRKKGQATSVLRLLYISLGLLLCCGEFSQAQESCCSGDDGLACSTNSLDYQGQRYNCYNLESPDINRACIQCLSPTGAGGVGQCSCCWATPNTLCDLEWSWGAVLATLSVSAVFATCSGILALAEKRRKRKGMSLARAWSIPHGMPVLRATVVDLSDAVRGRASIWGVDGLNGAGVSNEDLLEQVGLLEEIPSDSIYGALVGQHDADIPVAKLAEDNWATALAWRQHQQTATNSTSPVIYGDDGQGHEASSTDRWRSARATARQARHINSSGDGAAMAAGAVAAYRNSSQSVSSRSPEGRGDRVGGGSGGVGRGRGGWEQPVVVVIGERSRQSSTNERMSDGEEDLTTTAMVLPGRQSGGFSL